uniref:(northern house mosquito) hypothetical protein n=1 Tax=Culex pipiens TaxID=7175 RepID=A0A8D8IV31_CULPI
MQTTCSSILMARFFGEKTNLLQLFLGIQRNMQPTCSRILKAIFFEEKTKTNRMFSWLLIPNTIRLILNTQISEGIQEYLPTPTTSILQNLVMRMSQVYKDKTPFKSKTMVHRARKAATQLLIR